MSVELVLTDEFLNNVAENVSSRRVLAEIERVVSLLEQVPEMGSNHNLPQSIQEQFGKRVRRLSIAPFLVIYEYYPEEGRVIVESLMFERAAF